MPKRLLLTRSSYKNRGFTLIELLVVFSIMTILGSVGVASFVSYSRLESLNAAINDLKTTLLTARSDALSQLRDSSCYANGFNGNGYQLQGYQVVACCSFGTLCSSQHCNNPNNASNNYELQAVYAYPDGTGTTTQTCMGKKFTDPNLSIDSTSTTATYFFFSAVSGTVTTNAAGNPDQIGLTGYGMTKLATVSATGVIQ